MGSRKALPGSSATVLDAALICFPTQLFPSSSSLSGTTAAKARPKGKCNTPTRARYGTQSGSKLTACPFRGALYRIDVIWIALPHLTRQTTHVSVSIAHALKPTLGYHLHTTVCAITGMLAIHMSQMAAPVIEVT